MRECSLGLLRTFLLSLMEKRAKLTCDHCARTLFPGDRSVCAKRIPTALALLSFRGVFFLFFPQVHQEIGGCTDNDGGFEPRCSCCDACPLLTDFSPFLTVTTQHWRNKKSMYGTQDASHVWQLDNVNLICGEIGGFRRGKHSAAVFHNPNQDVRMAVHGR